MNTHRFDFLSETLPSEVWTSEAQLTRCLNEFVLVRLAWYPTARLTLEWSVDVFASGLSLLSCRCPQLDSQHDQQSYIERTEFPYIYFIDFISSNLYSNHFSAWVTIGELCGLINFLEKFSCSH